MLCVVSLGILSVPAAQAGDSVLPDELIVNVGCVSNIGTNVTLVLQKRSVRSDTYALVLETKDGNQEVAPFPVRTYRGYVREDPILRVNASINPDGSLTAVFSEGSGIVQLIENQTIAIPPGKGTPVMSVGNKVLPFDKAPVRKALAAGEYAMPHYVMRRARFTLYVDKSCIDTLEGNVELAVAQAEQRINAGDFVYARDINVAWELNTLVLIYREGGPAGLKPLRAIDLKHPDRASEKGATMRVKARGNVCMGGHAFVTSTGGGSGGVLLHEVGHAFGTSHHLDQGDCMQGCSEFIGPHNTQVMLWGVEKNSNYLPVVYSGALPPRALDDFANTRKDQPVTIDVLANDYDGNGDGLSIQKAGPRGDKGGAVVVGDDKRKLVYTPAPGFVGQDHFTYTVVDGTGAGNRTGSVNVDVRVEGGLATHLSFETVTVKEVRQKRRVFLETLFPNLGPYGGEATGSYVEPLAGQGVVGSSILCKGDAFAQVNIADAGNPGRGSLSASVWILYIQPVGPAGVIIEKGAVAYSFAHDFVQSGWAIGHGKEGKGFKFMGNTAGGKPEDHFSLQSEDKILTNTWYHLVMVMDREAKKLRAYVNNKEVTASPTTAAIPEGVIEYWTPLRLFNAIVWKKGGWQAFPAVMDEVKIFTGALTPKQVAELYAEGKNAKAPNVSKPVKPEPVSGPTPAKADEDE